MNCSGINLLSEDEIEFLDQKGYILLKNVLKLDEINKIKNRIEEIKQEEGSRIGDVRYGSYRKYLETRRGWRRLIAKLILKINDGCFWIMKFVIVSLRKYSGFFNQILYNIISDQSFYRGKNGFIADMKQMLLNIVQQQETKVERLCNLTNKGSEFDVFFTHPKVLACVEHIIGDNFKLSSLNMRAPKKGCWVQPMHVDWPWSVQPGTFYASNTLWMLDDITEENGPTRVIPRTHFTGKLPSEDLSDLQAPHPNEVHITGKAGSVLILNGHVWHGGTTNQSGSSRQLIQSYFVHKAHHPQQFQHLLITPETRARLNDEGLRILDIPIYNN